MRQQEPMGAGLSFEAAWVHFFVVVQSLSRVRLFANPWTAACQASLSFTISWSLLRFMSIELVMPSNHLLLCHPFSSCLQSFSASGSFPMGWLFVMWWPKYWSFSFSISPSNEYSRLISFRINCFDLLAVQGTLESSPTPLFKKHRFFGAQPSLWCIS